MSVEAVEAMSTAADKEDSFQQVMTGIPKLKLKKNQDKWAVA